MMNFRKYSKVTAVLLLSVIFSLVLSSCGAALIGNSVADEIANFDYEPEYKSSPAESKTTDNIDDPSEDTQKIIRTGRMTVESKEFDKAVSDIENMTADVGGYIQESNIRTDNYTDNSRRAEYTLRIPEKDFQQFISDISDKFNVTSKSTSSQDISETYYDTEARLKSLKAQEESLLALLEKADDLSYVLELNSALSDVRYQIESLTASLKRMENKVSYSTLEITIREVIEFTETGDPGFGERVSKAFGDSWSDFGEGCQDFFVALVYALPGLIIFAIIVLIIVLIIVKIVKKAKKSEAERQQQYFEALAKAQAAQTQNNNQEINKQ